MSIYKQNPNSQLLPHSTIAMEDTFKVRIDKIFGNLAPNSSSSLSSLWYLTDEEIERSEWKRDRESPEPEAGRSSFLPDLPKSSMGDVSEMQKDLKHLDDDDDDDDLDMKKRSGEFETESSNRPVKPDDFTDEEWEIKQCIGTDCTLDLEAEEDEYDRVALGGGDHMFMNDIFGYGIDRDSCNALPVLFKNASRDPRANHIAAKCRLEEDGKAVKKIDSLQITEKDEILVDAKDGVNPKSILKRKDGLLDPKRVRFDPDCKNNRKEENEGGKIVSMETCSTEGSSAVPDYIQNPSRYTHYTLDSLSDVDEESNRQAHMDFLKLVNRPNHVGSSPDEGYEDLPTVTFIPRKKLGGATLVQDSSDMNQSRGSISKDSMQGKTFPVCIAALNTEDGEVCAMDEDEPETTVDRKGGSQKMNRQYKMKGNWE